MKNGKYFILTLTVLIIALAGCSNTDNNSDPIEETKQEPNTTTEPENQTPSKPEIPQDETIAALVNKENSLEESYAPADLVKIDVPHVLDNPEINQLRKPAADALKEMFNKAEESGIYLFARSGYRSYATQAQLFKNYSERNGEEAANRYSARPGQSEHQTGLVMDVTSESVNFQLVEEFGNTKEGIWLSEHAHEFGFIIRYPKGKEDTTGYIYEPWHIRYLGVELATEVFKSGLTYEEFISTEEVSNGQR